MNLYWCSHLPVRRLQPAESYNSLSRSPVSPGRELQPPTSFKDHVSLIFRLDPRRSNDHQVYENQLISLYNKSSESPKHQINIHISIL